MRTFSFILAFAFLLVWPGTRWQFVGCRPAAASSTFAYNGLAGYDLRSTGDRCRHSLSVIEAQFRQLPVRLQAYHVSVSRQCSRSVALVIRGWLSPGPGSRSLINSLGSARYRIRAPMRPAYGRTLGASGGSGVRLCLHDYAAAWLSRTADLHREALLRGISETGVPTIEAEWVPPSKQAEIGATFTRRSPKPTLQCMFAAVEMTAADRLRLTRALSPSHRNSNSARRL